MTEIVVKEVIVEENVSASRRATTSLCTMSRHLPDLARLGELSPHVDELVLVLVDAVEHADEILHHHLDDHPILSKIPRTILSIGPSTHPQLYAPDVPETFVSGHPLAGEVYPGPFSDGPFLRDWSAARNLGFSMCSREWRISLDPGEYLANPGHVAGTIAVLDDNNRDVGYANHHVADDAPRGRSVATGLLARNLPALRWEGTARESLEGSLRPCLVDSILQIVPSTSPPLSDAEVFRVLYANAREKNWDVPPVDLLHMAKTARHAGLPDFAETAISAYLECSFYPEERAWACAIQGQLLEDRGDLEGACGWYDRSLAEQPGPKSFYKLSRCRHRQSRWQDCLNAYEAGLAIQNVAQLVDDGPETAVATLLCVASALQQLGHLAEARQAALLLRQLFPSKKSVITLCESLE